MAISSAPHEWSRLRGRPGPGAAAARTEEYYAAYARTVGGLCRALLRDRSEAEDATQQVFLSAYRALLNGSVPREPAAWLATIARNECWARVRARMREPLANADVEEAVGLPDPLAEAIRRADLAALWAAIEELPQQQREALLLREFGGLSYEELAEALAVTTPAVESLLFRARRQLRARLEAAYAAIGGASWAEALARLFAGSAPAAATKAVALGLGAAAVTGGAVVAPHVFDHPHRTSTPAAQVSLSTDIGVHLHHSPVASAPAVAAVVPVVETRRAVKHAFRAAEPSDTSDDTAQTETSDQGETTSTRERDRSSGDDRETSTTTAAPSEHDGEATASGPDGSDGGDNGASSSTPTTTTAQPAEQDDGGAVSNPLSGDPVSTVTVTVPSDDLSGGGD